MKNVSTAKPTTQGAIMTDTGTLTDEEALKSEIEENLHHWRPGLPTGEIAELVMGVIKDAGVLELAKSAVWRPIEEAPRDGTPVEGYKPFNGNWKENQDSIVEVRWGTDSFGFTGFMGLKGQRWGVTHFRHIRRPSDG